MSKGGYSANSATVITSDSAAAESLKKELEEMHKGVKAFVACLALFGVGWCDAEAATSKALPPIVVTEAPSTESAEMWAQYPDFFTRFKEVWINCPGRAFEKGTYIESAKWLNENTAQYRKILKTCRQYEAHGGKREWPPSPQTNKSLADRFFDWKCDGSSCSWVRRQ